MIDRKVLGAVLDQYAESVSISYSTEMLEDLGRQLNLDDNSPTRKNDPALKNFDAFAFAWNRMSNYEKFRFISLANREEHGKLFRDVQLDDRVKWSYFNNAQKAILIKVSQELFLVLMELFCVKKASAEYVERFVGGLGKCTPEEVAIMRSVLDKCLKGAA